MDLREIGSELNLSGAGWGSLAGFCEHGGENKWISKVENLLTS